MGRRKGTPEVVDTEAAPPPEDTPPPPDPPEGPDKNPALEKKRKDVAKGIWDPKASAALAKQLPSDKLVSLWEPVAEMFATMTDVSLMVLFGPDETMKQVGKLSEREMVVQAWAARLAVEPPENIARILSINLVMVYAFVFLPRIQRAWKAPLDEKTPPCVVTSVRRWQEDRRDRKGKERVQKGPAPQPARGASQGGLDLEGGGLPGTGTPAPGHN